MSVASRVSASLLNAIGLPELIAANLDAYERMAIHLATHSEALLRIKAKLAHNRLTKPLFNTSGFVVHLEAAYQKMWYFFREGQKPQQFEIAAG